MTQAKRFSLLMLLLSSCDVFSSDVDFRNPHTGSDYLVGARRNVDGIGCYSIHRNIRANLEVSLAAL